MSWMRVPPKRDVEHLQAAADGQHRQIGVERAAHEIDFERVAARFGDVELWCGRFAIQRRIHVVAAREQQPVHAAQRLGGASSSASGRGVAPARRTAAS
jgi:hypothetical protein